MQDCFRKYPDVYGAEIADEEAAEAEAEAVATGAPAPAVDASPKEGAAVAPTPSDKPAQAPEKTAEPSKKNEAHEFTTEEHKAGPTDAPKASQPAPTIPAAASQAVDKSDSPAQVEETSVRSVPKSSFDATAANSK